MSSLRLLNASVLTGSTLTLLFPHMLGTWVGNAGLALSWAQGTLAPPPPPQFWVILRSSPAQCKEVLILKHLQCLGAGCQEMVGSSQHWVVPGPGVIVSPESPLARRKQASEG